ncbi:MAG: AMP-binding protein [Candidatus Omnitrophica bacterium]|nr:AMP-binding protein [Candidatus Omnitrophota bacterium]MBU1925417.1 AMP-binding protein [Candidatus Omnitrophota bacterium]
MDRQEIIRQLFNNTYLGFVEHFEQACRILEDMCAVKIAQEDGRIRQISFRELWHKSKKIAAYLQELDIGQQKCVALLLENRPEWAVCFFGAVLGGCAVVPIEIKLAEKEISHIIGDCQSRVIFASREFLEKAVILRKTCPSLKWIICLDDIDFTLEGGDCENIIGLAAIIENTVEPVISSVRDNNDVALIVYTSGTMGSQKGVQLTLANLSFQLRAYTKILTPGFNDRFLSILPLSHTFEITCGLLGPLFNGSAVVYLGSFKSKDIIQAIGEHKITLMVIVPLALKLIHNGIMRKVEKLTRWKRLCFWGARFLCLSLRNIGRFLGPRLFRKIRTQIGTSLRAFVCGAAALDPKITRDFEIFGITVLEGYGLTETSPVISVNRFGDNKIGSVGKPLGGIEVKILKEKDRDKEGEIITRGPHLMRGYYKDAEKTAQIIRDGWLHTGDIGYFDRKGFLYITGRIKNVIVTGKGKKIHPEEIETELLRSPYIKDACVFGSIAKKGLRKGTEEVKAIIVPDLDYFISTAKLATQEQMQALIKQEINTISRHLAGYKRVVDFRIYNKELPKTTTLKVKRRYVHKLFEDNDRI